MDAVLVDASAYFYLYSINSSLMEKVLADIFYAR